MLSRGRAENRSFLSQRVRLRNSNVRLSESQLVTFVWRFCLKSLDVRLAQRNFPRAGFEDFASLLLDLVPKAITLAITIPQSKSFSYNQQALEETTVRHCR